MTTEKKKFIIERVFKAPKEVVFEAFSKAEALAQWWGPTGMSIQVMAFDFKPQGVFHYKLEGMGQIMWGLFKYGNISRPDLIAFVSSFSDENAQVCKSPFFLWIFRWKSSMSSLSRKRMEILC